MTYYSFSQAINKPPFLRGKLKDAAGGYTDCELKLYTWGKGTIIKIEGVNVNTFNLDRKEDIILVFENVSQYICNPCKSGYLFNVFFSDIPADTFLNSDTKIYIKIGERILADSNSFVYSRI